MLVNNKKAHHIFFCCSAPAFVRDMRTILSLFPTTISQLFRVCVYSVSVSRRCVIGCTSRSVVKRIGWVDGLQFGGWVRCAALRSSLGQLLADDFRARLSEVVAELQLNDVDAHRCQCETEDEIDDWRHHVNGMSGNEIAEAWLGKLKFKSPDQDGREHLDTDRLC